MSARQCLNCQNYEPQTPADFKPAYKGARFGLYELRERLGAYPEWNAGWPGKCKLQPIPVDVRSVDACAQWSVNNYFLESWEALCQHGRMAAEIRRLKDELKAVQKVSLERYRRLQEIAKKSGKKTKQRAAPPDPEATNGAQPNGAMQ